MAPPRIHGGLELKSWIHKHFQLKDVVNVLVVSPNEIWLKNPRRLIVEKNQRIGAVSNAHIGREFELVVQKYFKNKGIELRSNYKIFVGIDIRKKSHAFDLGAEDPDILVECKSHTWTSGNNVPSAKMTVWNEAMLYFSVAPPRYRKIFFVLRDVSESRKESLAEYYVRTYAHLIPPGVEIWEYDQEDGKAAQLDIGA